MKKRRGYLSLILFMIMVITACSSQSRGRGVHVSERSSAVYEEATAPATEIEMGGLSKEAAAESPAAQAVEIVASSPQRKLIKTVDMSVETKSFHEYVKGVQKKASEFGGYVSNFSQSDQSYGGYYSGNAYATIELKVPADALDAFMDIVQEGVNIRSQNINTTDVTLQYTDTESRIKALTTEQDRLMELIAKAESVDAIIVIESRLSEVRYELESYNSQLRLMDNQVQYSTVHLTVYDVQEYQTTKNTSYFEKIRIGFMENLGLLFQFISELFLILVTSLPTLLFLAVIVLIIIFAAKKFILRSGSRKKQKKTDSVASVKSEGQTDPVTGNDSENKESKES